MGERKEKLIREFSAGGVVFKKTPRKILWLIIKHAGTDRWQLPKGLLNEGESSKEAALREVEEEGGVKVRLIDKIGVSQYFYFFKGQRVFKTVTYFLMEYLSDTDDGHDHEVDEAVFLDFEGAIKNLSFERDKEILKKAKDLV